MKKTIPLMINNCAGLGRLGLHRKLYGAPL